MIFAQSRKKSSKQEKKKIECSQANCNVEAIDIKKNNDNLYMDIFGNSVYGVCNWDYTFKTT